MRGSLADAWATLPWPLVASRASVRSAAEGGVGPAAGGRAAPARERGGPAALAGVPLGTQIPAGCEARSPRFPGNQNCEGGGPAQAPVGPGRPRPAGHVWCLPLPHSGPRSRGRSSSHLTPSGFSFFCLKTSPDWTTLGAFGGGPSRGERARRLGFPPPPRRCEGSRESQGLSGQLPPAAGLAGLSRWGRGPAHPSRGPRDGCRRAWSARAQRPLCCPGAGQHL